PPRAEGALRPAPRLERGRRPPCHERRRGGRGDFPPVSPRSVTSPLTWGTLSCKVNLLFDGFSKPRRAGTMAAGELGPKAEGTMVGGWFTELDRLLRGELTRVSSLQRGGIEISPRRLSLIVIALAMSYGICMGTFALFRLKGPSVWQVVASMIKVPLLFYLTLLVTLPSLYVFNALVGSRLTLSTVVRLLVASLGVIVAVLASLGPIVAFFSVSTTSYPFMVLFNVVTFGVSGGLGLLFLLQ